MNVATAFDTGATLFSFVAALLHFSTELLVFKTMSIKGAISPMLVAGEFGMHAASIG